MAYATVKSGIKITLTIIITTIIIIMIWLEFLVYVLGHFTILSILSHPSSSNSIDKKIVPES